MTLPTLAAGVPAGMGLVLAGAAALHEPITARRASTFALKVAGTGFFGLGVALDAADPPSPLPVWIRFVVAGSATAVGVWATWTWAERRTDRRAGR